MTELIRIDADYECDSTASDKWWDCEQLGIGGGEAKFIDDGW
jgi:hypothetical protein